MGDGKRMGERVTGRQGDWGTEGLGTRRSVLITEEGAESWTLKVSEFLSLAVDLV